MTRTIYDDSLLKWEVYVSGGQPQTPEAARIFFLCLDDRMSRARFVVHESGSVSETERALLEMSDEELLDLLRASVTIQ